MTELRSLACAAAIVGVLSGCAGTTVDDASASRIDAERSVEDDWFCEPGEDGGWDCVQDPSRVANPRPLRLPKPLFAQPGGAAQAPFGSQAPRTALRQSATPEAPTPGAPWDSSTPLYQRLSYQPDRRTALTDLPGNFYAIQLVALSSREDLDEYIIDNNLPTLPGAVVENDGKRFYTLLAGIYTDRETAERAALSLPPSVRAQGPWIRSMESLQAAIARAEQLAE